MPFLDLMIIEWPIEGGVGRIWGGELLKREDELCEEYEVWFELCVVKNESKCEYWGDTWGDVKTRAIESDAEVVAKGAWSWITEDDEEGYLESDWSADSVWEDIETEEKSRPWT